MDILDRYNIYIKERYEILVKSGNEFDNYNLSKIFEYYSCIQLTKKYNQEFQEYTDIDPEFKEQNKMSRNDTGIDACNLIDTIVQCKLRKDTLTWEQCGTFFGSQNVFDSTLKKTIVRWNNLIITRNKESQLSKNLKEKQELFTDITYSRDEIINYCNSLLKNPPVIKINKEEPFKLRDYQLESIELIKNNGNVIISLPTGSGKNIVIIFSMSENERYLILVPRIILMNQIKTEIIKHKPEFKNKIQTIGDSRNYYDETKDITICVYNSVSIIENYCDSFDKIFIDEAHHINIPEIYKIDDDIDDIDETNEESDGSDYETDYDTDYEIDDEIDDETDYETDYETDEETESILKDDTEDEIKNTTGYNKIIKSLSKYNNNVYLSATIDEHQDFTYYKKDIRDMINNKYLCDYTINIPIFSDDPSDKNICEYLINNYINIIVYCNSQKEGKKINELLNRLQKGCSEYIDCLTSKEKRDTIIKEYKKGKIKFLVNVRILVEGFDAPITKGVYFIHLPTSKTTIIQIMGRALRLHPLKTIANIILPFSSNDEGVNINKFLKILALNDTRIRKSYESKNNGGYISIIKIKDDDDDNNDEEDKDIEFRYEMIYDSMRILKNGNEIWINKLEWVKKYIDENKKRPSQHDETKEIKTHGKWIHHQLTNYQKKLYIMSENTIRKLWEDFINDDKYKEYFLSNEKNWKLKLEWVKKYINENNKRPTRKNKDEKKYGAWLTLQVQNYQKKKEIMSNETIRKLWEYFINDDKYKEYFLSNEEVWKLKLEEIKNYINKNKKRPSNSDTNEDIKIYASWINTQQNNYQKKQKIMSNETIIKLWEDFINDDKYKEYFICNKEVWKSNLEWVKKYIDENKKRPSTTDKNNDVKIYGSWISTQIQRYKKKKEIMSNETIRKLWEYFINDDKYKEYFLSNEEVWKLNLELIKKYIDENKIRPSQTDENDEVKKHCNWISNQLINYQKKKDIMSNETIRKLWEDFINDDKYKEYFLSNEEQWKLKLECVKKYIDENKKRPYKSDKNEEVKKYCNWISNQLINYQKKEQIMLDDNIKKLWEDFINDDKYKKFFLSNEEVWKLNLELIKKYIDENKKRPYKSDKNEEVKKYCNWISNQLINYQKKEQIMLDDNIKKLWEDFINDDKYKEYFLSNKEEWKLNLEWVKKYIDENKKRPSMHNKNDNIKIYGSWIHHQLTNYKKKNNSMSNETIRKLWEDFINDDKYKEYFISNEEVWKLKLEWVKKYINENKKRPSTTDKNNDVKIYGSWISHQQQNYQKKEQIMLDNTIKKLWEDFINDDKYKEYF